MSIFSDLLFGKSKALPSSDAMQGAIGNARGQAGVADSTFMNRMASFDPSQAFKDYATGAFSNFKTNMGLKLSDLAEKSTGAGRFSSGFFDQDQGQLVREMSQDFTSNLNQHALDATHLEEENNSMLGNYSLSKDNQYLDLMSGQLDREQAEENAKRQQRSGFVNGLLGAGAMAAGARGG